MTSEEHDRIQDARRDETERCALLCEMRADISRVSARKIREQGSYTVRNLWPFWSKSVAVMPRFERAARDCEEVAHAFDVVADCIRKGYDPRDLNKPGPDEQVDLEVDNGDGGTVRHYSKKQP